MGCSDSKDSTNKICVESAKEKLKESIDNLEKTHSASSLTSSGMGSSASSNSVEKKSRTSASSVVRQEASDKSLQIVNMDADDEGDDTMGELRATVLDTIPNNDLGESLDARRMQQMWSRSSSCDVIGGSKTTSGTSSMRRRDVITAMSANQTSSAKSEESSDSGIYDLEDDYSFVITESSSPAKIETVEREFTPLENIDLTITGKACPRLLSGSQRARQQEADILQNLRDEGFITTSKLRAGGGLAFEVVESTPASVSAGGKIKPKDFLPNSHKQHLDEHRTRHHLHNLSSADIEMRQKLAHERRKAELESKVVKLVTHNRISNHEDQKIEELKRKKEQKDEAALEKREAHLRDLRDKLKAKNKKVQQIKLKKLINAPPVPIPIASGFQKRKMDGDGVFTD